MSVAKKYIKGLEKAYVDNNQKEEWKEFVKVKNGISNKDLMDLKKEFPNIPASLIEILEFVDGTYWREYKGEEITFYFLGSTLEDYPYYLLSAQQMLENKNTAFKYYEDYINREFGDDVEIDNEIIDKADEMKWLHFSDCMNNGGTSQLFIDFSPSPKGTKGQVVMFVHDPDELRVIAKSFDEYLQMLINNKFAFICEEEY